MQRVEACAKIQALFRGFRTRRLHASARIEFLKQCAEVSVIINQEFSTYDCLSKYFCCTLIDHVGSVPIFRPFNRQDTVFVASDIHEESVIVKHLTKEIEWIENEIFERIEVKDIS